MVNQVSNQSDNNLDAANSSTGNFLQNLSGNQYWQVINLLSAHLTNATHSNESTKNPSTFYSTGTCLSVSMKQNLSSTQFWIVDSGASRHDCSCIQAFDFMHPIKPSSVTLPNNITIPVHFGGDVKLTPTITLKDVLFVPQFHFNLISMSALHYASPLMLVFFLIILQSRKYTIRG